MKRIGKLRNVSTGSVSTSTTLHGGPWHGRTIRNGGNGTLTFTITTLNEFGQDIHWRGRYSARGHWIDATHGFVL